MEDSVTFELWAQISRPVPTDAGAWLQAHRPALSLLQAKLEIARGAASNGESVLVAAKLGCCQLISRSSPRVAR
jgi:hypothetical protein